MARPGLLSRPGGEFASQDVTALATVEAWQRPQNIRRSCRILFSRCVEIVFPWALAVLIGALTSATGIYIAINVDYLSDIRLGRCRGFPLRDRNRCCGGADNIDSATGRCIRPAAALEPLALTGEGALTWPEWVPWEQSGLTLPFAIYLSTSVALSGLAACVVYSYAPPTKGSGIPDVKAAVSGFAVQKSFTVACLVVKSIGLAMGVGAGLALGKEGPLIQIGVCWVYILRGSGPVASLADTIPFYELVCVGAAAGVSTAFGAPVGGVLFAVEELGSVRALSQRALLLAFTGSFAASFVLKSWNIYGSNQITFFALSTSTNSPSKEWISSDVMLFLLLGAVGGLVGSLFIHLNLLAVKRRKRFAECGRIWLLPTSFQDAVLRRLPRGCLQWFAFVNNFTTDVPPKLNQCTMHVIEVAIIATVTCSMNYPFTNLLRKPMVEVIHGLFEACPQGLSTSLGLCSEETAYGLKMDVRLQGALLFAAFSRLLQAVTTFGAMIPSGLFIPSLYMGAVLGRLVGIVAMDLNMKILDPDRQTRINPSVCAMVGAVAVLSGFARMTVSLVVIMLELTGELNYAVPFMCSVLTAKLIGDMFTVSVYDAHAALLGYASIEEPKDLRLAAQVSDVATAVRAVDLLDILNPVPIETLWRVVRESVDDEQEALPICRFVACGEELVECQAQREEKLVETNAQPQLPVLLLLRSDPRGGHDTLAGLVERCRLRAWLEGLCGDARGDLCAFSSHAMANATWSNPSRQTVHDLSDLLEPLGATRRLMASAPVLTAACAFREYSSLKYCICRDETDGCSLSVLSRDELERALTDGRFAAAFPASSPELDTSHFVVRPVNISSLTQV